MKFAVLVSGSGTNLQAIIDAVNAGDIQGTIAIVVSSNPSAYALKRAEGAGIKTLVVDPKEFTNRQSGDRAIVMALKEEGIDFIVLAGYMRLLTPYFVKEFKHKIINVHPSLLPSFKGVEGIKDALTYGAKVTGVTIHFVDDKLDHGPIILQEAVKIAEDENLHSLEAKIHKIEHKLYPKAIQLFIENRLKIKGRKVEILEK